jgi:hypothetical protein
MPHYGLADRYGHPRARMGLDDRHLRHLALGEVAVRRGERVHATDGTVGQVQGLVIDTGSRHVTYVLPQEGSCSAARK